MVSDREAIKHLTKVERDELNALLVQQAIWQPLSGPQERAYMSDADVIGYGGAAGGGKTDLAIGLSLTKHQRVGIFRQIGTELTAINDRISELQGGRKNYNGQDKIWRLFRADGAAVQIELGSFPSPGDEAKYRGRPHDLLVFDEASEMREQAVRFLMGWLRTTDEGQPCRALMCFNPPTEPEGRWVMEYFSPWLDKKHVNPAQPGELRWFAAINGVDHEVPDERPFIAEENGEWLYDFDPKEHKPSEIIRPMSRTFIPSRITDNRYLMGTGYMRQLQSMPEPLRSQLLYGDFHAGVQDSPWQVVPTSWVEVAMERWVKHNRKPVMESLGVDVAMGGNDKTIIARRHGMWFDEPIVYTGAECKDGPTIAGFVISAKRDAAVIHIDLFGVGAQPYGHLMALQQQIIGVNVGEPARGVARDGALPFKNLRSELWWRMREALDPAANTGICLPPSKQLLADLCAPQWKVKGAAIQVESREDIVKKIGRSPDYGSAYCLALMATPKQHVTVQKFRRGGGPAEYDPYGQL